MAIEIFSTILIVTIACILFSSIISMHTQTSNARGYYNIVVNRIEDSNYNQDVIKECIEEAQKKGYKVTVSDMTVYEDNPSKLVVMDYDVIVPIFQILGERYTKKAVIEGYAR